MSVWEVVLHTGLNAEREREKEREREREREKERERERERERARRFSVYHKMFFGSLKWSHTKSISIISLIFLFLLIKAWVILIQNNKYYRWMEIEESPEYKFYDNIGNLSIRSFRYRNNDTKTNPWVMLYSHCAVNNALHYLNTTGYFLKQVRRC